MTSPSGRQREALWPFHKQILVALSTLKPGCWMKTAAVRDEVAGGFEILRSRLKRLVTLGLVVRWDVDAEAWSLTPRGRVRAREELAKIKALRTWLERRDRRLGIGSTTL